MTIAGAERFAGRWELVPGESRYAFGSPPKQGTLTFHVDGERLRYDMAWTTPDDKAMQMTIEVAADGQAHPYDGNPTVADATRYTVVDEFTLDSEALKGGAVTAYARRVIAPDGQTMRITQSGTTPAGAPFDNHSTYRRV